MKNLAIIPARGGSKRIPRKNIKDFLGKPIIAYSIETALESGLFKEVMVSTDDEEIAEVAQEYGAKVPFMRSPENADDYATTVDVLLEVIREYKVHDKHFENICCLYPTAPLTDIEDLKKGLELLSKGGSSLPVMRFNYPLLRALEVEKNDLVKYAWPEYEKARSQDLDTYYHDAGQWYWSKVKELIKYETFITPNTHVIIKREMEVHDIDTHDDWKLAELKYKCK